MPNQSYESNDLRWRQPVSIPNLRFSQIDFPESRIEAAWLTTERVKPVGPCWIGILFLLVLSVHFVLLLQSDWQTGQPHLESVPKPVSVSLISLPNAEPRITRSVRKPRSDSRHRKVVANRPKPASRPKEPEVVKPVQNLPVENRRIDPDRSGSTIADAQATSDADAGFNDRPDSAASANQPASFDSAYLHNPSPPYPALSRRLHEQGLVLLSVYVSSAGNAAKVTLRRSSGYSRLDQAALKCVKTWRFEPARREGLAINSSVIVPIRFSLEG